MAKFLDKTGLDTFWAKIKSTFQTLGNLVTAWGSTPSDTKYPSEKLVKDSLDGKQATLAFDGTYNASTNKAATVSTVTNAIGGLDVSSVGGNGKYISAISETDGKISATETDIDDALSATSLHPVQNKELTRWHNVVIGEDGFVSGSAANPQLSLQKSRLGALSLYNAGVNIKIYSFDEDDEENATLEWDISTASDSIKDLYNKGEQTGTLYQSTAGKWVKILYTGTTASYFRALGVFMDTKDSSSTASNFYGHLRIGGVDYPESAQFSTWGSLVVAAYSKSSTKTVEFILRPKSATCMCRIFGFRCLNTYTGSDAILIGKASSATTAQNYDTNTGTIKTALDTKVSKTSNTVLNNDVTTTWVKYSNRKITISGNEITLDMSASGGGWAGGFAYLKDASATHTMLGFYGASGALIHFFMGGTYNNPYFKMTPDGVATFKNSVRLPSISSADGSKTYTLNSSTGGELALKSQVDDKVDKETGKGLSTNDYTTTEKNKLAGIAEGATKVEASTTNGKVKINGTDTTVYTHPTSSGNKHVPSGGSSGQFLGWSADGTAAWSDLPKDYTTLSPSSATIRAYKRYTIGKTNVNLSSANSVRATALIRIHVNYNDDLANSQVAEGMLITMLADICFRTGSLAEMRLDIIGESRWDYSKIRPVLVSFGITEDGITKYVIAIGFGDGTNGTTLQAFDYSYIDVMPLFSNDGWYWMNEGDNVGTYDYIAQAVRETGARLGTAVGSSKLPVYVNDKGEFAEVTASSTATELLCALPAWTATPTDSTYLVRRDTGGAASYGQVTFETVWNYIKGKMSSDPSGVLNGRVSGFTSNIWGTGAKRISLGYANMSATDSWYNAIFLLKTGYNATIGDGRSIALMISYCHRSTGRRVSARVLVNNGWPLSLIPGVFTLETDNNTKLVVGVGVRDSNNDFVNLQYSEFNVVVLGKEESWTDNVTSDSVNACDHWFPTAQQPDIVVVDELPSSPDSNNIYFV